jgi:hypothetical protein
MKSTSPVGAFETGQHWRTRVGGIVRILATDRRGDSSDEGNVVLLEVYGLGTGDLWTTDGTGRFLPRSGRETLFDLVEQCEAPRLAGRAAGD